MLIKVTEVLDVANKNIRFQSGGNLLQARWAGVGSIPVGSNIDVELEIAEENIVSARLARGPLPESMEEDGDVVVITGLAAKIFPDGVVELRVGQDLVLLESSGIPVEVVEGAYLELRVSYFEVYPTDI